MAKILTVATHATDDPTKASLAFVTAAGALAGNIEVGIALLGEATYLAKPAIANSVQGVGFGPLKDVIAALVEAKVPMYV